MFLETEASFPYCNWSTKMAGIIWLGSTSVQHVNNWQRLSRLPFLSLCKSRKFLETKTYSFISIKKKIICKFFSAVIFFSMLMKEYVLVSRNFLLLHKLKKKTRHNLCQLFTCWTLVDPSQMIPAILIDQLQ